MSEEALMTGLIGAGEKVDTLWNMFITVHMAIFGFYLLNKRKLGWPEVSVAFVGYLGFAWINANALIYAYDLLGGFYAQYRIQHGNPERFAKMLYSVLIDKEFANRATVVWSVHGAAICIVALALRNLCKSPHAINALQPTHIGGPPLAEAERAMHDIDAQVASQQTALDDKTSPDEHGAPPPPNPYQPPDNLASQVSTDKAAPPTTVPGYDPNNQDESGIPSVEEVNPDPVLTDELAKALRRAQTNTRDARKSTHPTPHKHQSGVTTQTTVDANYRPPRGSVR